MPEGVSIPRMVGMTSRMVNRSANSIGVIPFFEAVKRLILFVFLVSPLFGWAQHPSYWVLNHEQGLPSLKVYDLMEDSLGVVLGWNLRRSGALRWTVASNAENRVCAIARQKHAANGAERAGLVHQFCRRTFSS